MPTGQRLQGLPRMSAALVPRELLSWSLTAIALGALEGGLLGVIVKIQFSEVGSPALVNFAVAVVAGAPSFANLSSFIIAPLAQGRDKIVLLSRLMLLMGVCLVLMAFPPTSGPGLVFFTLLAIVARAAWSGILTVRAAVWRANYERNWRGRVTARIVQFASLLVAGVSALTGLLMDWHGDAWRAVFPLAGLSSVAAFYVYRRTRVRGHHKLLQAERAELSLRSSSFSLQAMAAVLKGNREFRNYMLGMMVFGSGNLMIIAMLVILMNDYFTLPRLHQVMITSSLPLLVLFVTIAHWAKVLDRRHIFTYRAIHSWNFVSAHAVFAVAALANMPGLLWLGSLLLGSAYAGGHLGWNLGHNDFTSDADSSLYMAIHVSLTGLRGLFMPIVGVAFFQYLESVSPGHGAYAMLLPMALCLLGSFWFVYLHFDRAKNA
jgi:MFS family permease